MGLKDVLQDYVPIDMEKKKILQGEGVIQVKSCGTIVSKKNEKEYLTFKAEVINVVKSKEEYSLVAGNIFDLIMEVDDEKKVKKLQNNLFTAGLALDVSSDEALSSSLQGLENKLIYGLFGKGKFTPEGETEVKEFQTYRFCSPKRLTPENSIPNIPF